MTNDHKTPKTTCDIFTVLCMLGFALIVLYTYMYAQSTRQPTVRSAVRVQAPKLYPETPSCEEWLRAELEQYGGKS